MIIKIQSSFLLACTLLSIVDKNTNTKNKQKNPKRTKPQATTKKSKAVFFLVMRIRSVCISVFKNHYQFFGLNIFNTLDSSNYGHIKSKLLV